QEDPEGDQDDEGEQREERAHPREAARALGVERDVLRLEGGDDRRDRLIGRIVDGRLLAALARDREADRVLAGGEDDVVDVPLAGQRGELREGDLLLALRMRDQRL